MDNILHLPGQAPPLLALPAPTEHAQKWLPLQEKLRQRKQRYLEGIKMFGTVQEAMQYAEIRSRQTLVNYRRSDPNFADREREMFQENDGIMQDLAEKQLFLKIKSGEMRAITYFLDRKHPEYRPKGDLQVNHTTDDKVAEALDDIKQLIQHSEQ